MSPDPSDHYVVLTSGEFGQSSLVIFGAYQRHETLPTDCEENRRSKGGVLLHCHCYKHSRRRHFRKATSSFVLGVKIPGVLLVSWPPVKEKNQKFVSFPFSVLTFRSSLQRTFEIAIVLFHPVSPKLNKRKKKRLSRYRAYYFFLDDFNRR